MVGRALVAMWVVSLLMSFGRTTFGSLYDIVPGSSDVFLRRFQMGVHLSGILLAGVGLALLGQVALDGAGRLLPPGSPSTLGGRPGGARLTVAICILGLVVVLAPAWTSLDTYDAHNTTNIGLQAADDLEQPQIDRVLDYVAAHPRGHVYAGQPTNWGNDFLVGNVPVFKYLESKDVDEVGYTLRTASLMTDPEYFFDDTNPGDYPLFGIGYLIVPRGHGASGPGRAGRCARAPTACGPSPTRDTSTCTTPQGCWRDPSRRRIPQRHPVGLATTRRAAGPDRGLQRERGVRARRLGTSPCFGDRRVTSWSSMPTWSTGRRAPWCGPTDRHRGAQRVLRPWVARHRGRAIRPHGDGGAGAGGRGGGSRHAHRRLQLRRLRLVSRALRARSRRPGRARRRSDGRGTPPRRRYWR